MNHRLVVSISSGRTTGTRLASRAFFSQTPHEINESDIHNGCGCILKCTANLPYSTTMNEL